MNPSPNRGLCDQPDPQELEPLAAEGFEEVRSALAEGRTEDYLDALDILAECCPP